MLGTKCNEKSEKDSEECGWGDQSLYIKIAEIQGTIIIYVEDKAKWYSVGNPTLYDSLYHQNR